MKLTHGRAVIGGLITSTFLSLLVVPVVYTAGAGVTYGEVRRRDEYEHSKYYFEVADVTRVRQMYDLYKAEAAKGGRN